MGDAKLLELAERLEKASGPDRELERDIAYALGWTFERNENGCDDDDYGFLSDPYIWVDPTGQPQDGFADWTSSLDAAMTLVPEGWALSLLETTDGYRRDHRGDPLAPWTAALIEHKNTGYKVDQRGCWRKGLAATPELALCAAALRARTQGRTEP